MRLLFCALVLVPAVGFAKSAAEVAAVFVVPPAFKLESDRHGHGVALISQQATRDWVDALGIRLHLAVDDTNVISSAFIGSQFVSIADQVKKLLPDETIAGAQVFTVKGHDWVLVRTKGFEGARAYLHV